jgi:hypothetical protein
MKQLVVLALIFGFSSVTFAHAITEEQRKEKIEFNEKMSERYKAAAECLKAGKPLDDCNKEAMQGCPMMGKNCPFMEKGNMDKEMMREHMKKMNAHKSE